MGVPTTQPAHQPEDGVSVSSLSPIAPSHFYAWVAWGILLQQLVFGWWQTDVGGQAVPACGTWVNTWIWRMQLEWSWWAQALAFLVPLRSGQHWTPVEGPKGWPEGGGVASKRAWLTRALTNGRRAPTASLPSCPFSEVVRGWRWLGGWQLNLPQEIPGTTGHTWDPHSRPVSALFSICYALMQPGPQIPILWLVFITLYLTQYAAIHEAGQSVALWRPTFHPTEEKEARQSSNAPSWGHKQVRVGWGKEFKELPEWVRPLEQLREEEMHWSGCLRKNWHACPLLSGDW